MRVSVFHVIFNVTTTVLLLPFVKQLVQYSCAVIRDKKAEGTMRTLKYVDDRLLSMPPIAFMQAKKEIDYMLSLVEENIGLSAASIAGNPSENAARITENEEIIDFTNSALTNFLIKLSAHMDGEDEQKIGSYYHVLNDLERIGDHAENFHEIGLEMLTKKLSFSETGLADIRKMFDVVQQMLIIAKEAFDTEHPDHLPELTALENQTDEMKRAFSAMHFSRLSEGHCSLEVSPYFTSAITGLERVADHIVNVGYSICNPIGDDDENN
jgi:phosphate:Na+ symporter